MGSQKIIMKCWASTGARRRGGDQESVPEACQKYHPDTNKDNPQAEQKFKRGFGSVYDSDPEKKNLK